MNTIIISIVIPLYNEEAVFHKLVKSLDALLSTLDYNVEVVLVDDGSTDSTTILMKQLALFNSKYSCVFLSRNYGHQIALSAGLAQARGTDGVYIIDGDLQDPPELLPVFYKKMKEGFDVVYGIRKKRKEPFFKRMQYHIFYRIQRIVTSIDIPMDSGDFAFLSRRVVDILNNMPEESKFIRGQRAWIGLEQVGIEYERDKRIDGKSKYSFKMLFKLALDGIFNYTEIPVKMITKLGFLTIFSSSIYLGIALVHKFINGTIPQGFTGLLFTLILFSGVQLISLGIIGEYLVRIFFQTKNRPLYIVKETIINKSIKE